LGIVPILVHLEMFSVGNTIVLSRGLIDVVPNEETLAALPAHGMADALLPKPYQDQYAFQRYLAAVTHGGAETAFFRGRENGNRREHPEGNGTSEKVPLRVQSGECRTFPKTTALASKRTETIDQSSAWK
jgi:hypothetical protein